jgi:hypothetical protein
MAGQNVKGDDFGFSLNLEIDGNIDLRLLIFIFAIIKILKLVIQVFSQSLCLT